MPYHLQQLGSVESLNRLVPRYEYAFPSTFLLPFLGEPTMAIFVCSSNDCWISADISDGVSSTPSTTPRLMPNMCKKYQVVIFTPGLLLEGVLRLGILLVRSHPEMHLVSLRLSLCRYHHPSFARQGKDANLHDTASDSLGVDEPQWCCWLLLTLSLVVMLIPSSTWFWQLETEKHRWSSMCYGSWRHV